MTNKKCDVSIIFVNYKNTELVVDAIKSVKEKSANFSYELIVVDNSCDEEVFSTLKEKLDDGVLLIDAKENLGFGKGNNLGAKYANGKYLYFLNTDTILINNAIYELFSFMEKNENCGACGANLYTKDMGKNTSFSLYEWNYKNIKKNFSFLTLIKKRIFNKSDFFNDSDKPIEVKDIIGATLFIRADVFNEIKGFDEDIFMYAEETLLCFNVINKAKLKLYNVPSAKIIHLEGGSTKGPSKFISKCSADGNYIYLTKAFGKKEALRCLKAFKKVNFKRMILAKLLFKKNKAEGLKNMYNAYKNKIKEVND